MRDPLFDPLVGPAIEETRLILGGLVLRLGMLREGVEIDPDARVRAKVGIILNLESARVEYEQRVRKDERDYIWRLIDQAEKAGPPKHEGRRANALRDRTIADMLARLQVHYYKINPTRNRERSQHGWRSGCDIVAQVLREIGIEMSERAVEKIWERLGKTADHHRLPFVYSSETTPASCVV